MRPLAPLALALSLFAAGCVGSTPAAQQAEAGHGRLLLTPEIVPGGLRTQASVDNYTTNSIQHLIVKVFRLNGNTEQPVLTTGNAQVLKDVPRADLDKTITFENLTANTTFRIRCYAYKAEGEAAGDLISTSDAASYVDVFVEKDDTPAMATLKVRLIDVVFSGTATSSGVNVTDGGYLPSGSVAIH